MTNMDFKLAKTILEKKKLTKKDIEGVKGFLEYCSHHYYNTDSLVISDTDYDTLYNMYKLKTGDIIVGAEPDSTKGTASVAHSYEELVGTLHKCQNINDLREWLTKIINKYGTITICITLKFDGNSVVIEYNNGNTKQALTRGKNGKGVDLTYIFKDHKIKSKENVGIKYEVVVSFEDFKKLIDDTGIAYVNPRSLISGLLGKNEAYDFVKYMTLVPLWVKHEDGIMEKEEQLEFIEENFGEESALFEHALIITADNIDDAMEEIEAFYNNIIDIRQDLNFMIDGLVIDVMEEDIKEDLGSVQNEPKWATALKFPYLQETTQVERMDFTMGDTGIITPRVWFKPVKFFNSTHQKQSLNNYKRFKELGLGVGSDILVSYSNDCLTYVERLDNDKNKNIEPIPFPDKCPVCNHAIEINENETFAYCVNNECNGKVVGRIQNYLVKMDIKGIKEATIQRLKDAGLIKHIEDLYTIDYEEVSNVEGLGKTIAKNMKKALDSKVPYDYEILGSLGIENISLDTAKLICTEYSLMEVLEMYRGKELFNKIVAMKGFSEIMANHLIKGLESNSETILFLMEQLNFKEYKSELSQNQDDVVYNIVFTGFRDKDVKKNLELRGHKISSGVSKKTDLVVASNPSEGGSKLNKARELGIEILSVQDFKDRFSV